MVVHLGLVSSRRDQERSSFMLEDVARMYVLLFDYIELTQNWACV